MEVSRSKHPVTFGALKKSNPRLNLYREFNDYLCKIRLCVLNMSIIADCWFLPNLTKCTAISCKNGY